MDKKDIIVRIDAGILTVLFVASVVLASLNMTVLGIPATGLRTLICIVIAYATLFLSGFCLNLTIGINVNGAEEVFESISILVMIITAAGFVFAIPTAIISAIACHEVVKGITIGLIGGPCIFVFVVLVIVVIVDIIGIELGSEYGEGY